MPDDRITYRADTRAPSEIFISGFTPRFAGGIKIHDGGQVLGGVSTSKELPIAMKYAAMYEGYVYAVRAKGVDVLQHMITSRASNGAIANAMTQMEIHCEIISPINVLAARKAIVVDSGIRLSGALEINPLNTHAPEIALITMVMSTDMIVDIPHNHR
ncbi:hypothetical protein CWS43_17465 [Rahnella sp. AA]|uniref:hypothetical protein n=1 Tax=Rahnella sp. AA TaxID=2057180 RepID=UPI000C32A5F3|nr:hypothetical protein [Rahnella sp. AA]PKE29215.1 hypothetical protein CWS43_17465 [Rahnella sp. AA]